MHERKQACRNVSMDARTHVCLRLCMYTCMQVCRYVTESEWQGCGRSSRVVLHWRCGAQLWRPLVEHKNVAQQFETRVQICLSYFEDIAVGRCWSPPGGPNIASQRLANGLVFDVYLGGLVGLVEGGARRGLGPDKT